MSQLIRIAPDGRLELHSLEAETDLHATLRELLQTDVTERMRVPAVPDTPESGSYVLCYFIDARGGDRSLPANFVGTCFYHTGCPVFGDVVLAACEQDSDSAAVSGFSPEETAALKAWLLAQFPEYLHEGC